MLLLAHLLKQNPVWHQRPLRLMRAVSNEAQVEEATEKLQRLIEKARIPAKPNVVVAGNPAVVVKELDPQRGFTTRMDYFKDPAGLERFFDAINEEVLAGNSLARWLWSVLYPGSRTG